MNHKLKKVLIILFVIFGLAGGGIFWLYTTANTVQTELNAVVEPIVRDMAALQWDKSAIDKYASPALKQWMMDNKLTEGIPGFKILGNVKAYQGIQQFNATANKASLVSSVQFDQGDATVTMALSKQNGVWLVDSLNINSPLFLQSTADR